MHIKDIWLYFSIELVIAIPVTLVQIPSIFPHITSNDLMILHSCHDCSPEADVGTQALAQPHPNKQQLYWASYIMKQ